MASPPRIDVPAGLPAGLDERLARRVLDATHAGVLLVRAGRVLYANPMMTRLFGWTQQELMSPDMDPYRLVAAADRDEARAEQERRVRTAALDGGRSYELRCERRDGVLFDARAWGGVVVLDDGPAELITLTDMSELSRTARALQRRAHMQAQAERLASMGSAETRLDSGRTWLSEGLCRMLGEEPLDHAVDEDWLLERVPPDERPLLLMLRQSVTPGDPCELRHHVRHRDGSLRLVTHCRAIEPALDGDSARALTILRDVTEEAQAALRLDRLAYFDEPTSMPNRRALRHWIDEAVGRAGREQKRFALLVLDVAQVAAVADTLGEAAADALRKLLADRLSLVVRSHDTLAALGGGSFAALLLRSADVSEDDAMQLARAMLAAMAVPASVEDRELGLTTAIGVALFPADGTEAETLLQHAQTALREAQAQGPGRIGWYRPEANARAAQRLAMEAGLRRALEREEFDLVYQPQVALASGRMVGVEALLRWNDPQRGLVMPAQFVPVAESTGQIVPIGDWVLRHACAQAARWARAGHPLRVSVNLSVLQLQQPDIAERIQQVLLETGLDPRCLGLEVTESMLVDQLEHVVTMLRQLRSIGIEISLDDFGTGYSNLGRLRHLPIDVVKIDRSLVHDVTALPEDVSITRAVIALAHSLQLQVLAEGVETEGQLALLSAHGCDQVQGWWYSAALPVDGIDALLATPKPLATPLGTAEQPDQRTLLIVDDEANVLSALRRLLRRSNCRIVTASSGAEGLQRLAEQRIDLIISDQRMPGMTGVEFLRRAKVLYPETVRVVLSGYTELQSVTDAINEGAIYKFLTKPWDDAMLVKLVDDAFQQKAMADENRRLTRAVAKANTDLATVNRRLQVALQSQHEQFHREETLLTVARDMLESLPVPVIGIDSEGVIVFVNAQAEGLFPPGTPLLGSAAAMVLPADLLSVWQSADPAAHCCIALAAGPFWASCRPVTGKHGERGRLLVLVPRPTLAEPA